MQMGAVVFPETPPINLYLPFCSNGQWSYWPLAVHWPTINNQNQFSLTSAPETPPIILNVKLAKPCKQVWFEQDWKICQLKQAMGENSCFIKAFHSTNSSGLSEFSTDRQEGMHNIFKSKNKNIYFFPVVILKKSYKY